ncbi:MAG: HEAT repeat domain-containing protein [Planctomycetota bacterium]|jgi:predicted esterase
MRGITHTILGLPLLLLAVALAAAPAAAEQRTHGPTGLEYELLTPSGWSAATPVELFVCLHGAGDNAANFRSAVEGAVTPMKQYLRIYVNSPSRQGWPGDADGKVLQLVKDLKQELNPKRIFGFGFSAGGYMTTSTAFPNPDLYAGAVVTGATFRVQPPANDECRSKFWYWSLGDQDALVKQSGGIETVRKGFANAKYDPTHYVVDVVEGLAHRLDGKSLSTGVAWVVAQSDAADQMTAEDKRLADSVSDPVKAGDAAAIRAIAAKIVATRRAATKHYFWGKVKKLCSSKEPELVALAIELAGELGAPAAAKDLAKLLSKEKANAEGYVALITIMGKLGEGAVKPLGKLLSKWEHDGKPQIAAAQALGAIGSKAALGSLLKALKSAEKKEERAAYTEALNAALQRITGAKETGSTAWKRWLATQGR